MEKSHTFSAASITDPVVKKLYKSCVECVNALQSPENNKNSSDAYLTTTPIRKRLRESCEKLLFMNPVDFGRRADEILWRKCFYEPIKQLRQNKGNISNQWFLNMLLTSAIGYYNLLSLKIQQEISKDGDKFSLDFGFSFYFSSPGKAEADLGKIPERNKWFMDELHRILIYQGDLARYLYEIDETADIRTAQHYYYQALALNPRHGTPYNQLGTLFLSMNFGLDAAYYYLRSISSKENFSGSENNLLTLLSKNDAVFNSFIETANFSNLTPENVLKYFCMNVLSMANILYTDDRSMIDSKLEGANQSVIYSFSTALQHFNFNESLNFTRGDFTKTFDSNVIFKTFVIFILLIELLNSKGSNKITTATALFSSLFTQFLNRIIAELSNENGEENIEAKNTTKNSKSTAKEVKVVSKVSPKASPIISKKTNFAIRRRRRGSENDSEGEDGNAKTSDVDSEKDAGLSPSVESEDDAKDDNFNSASESDDIIDASDDDELCLRNLVQQEKTNENGEDGDNSDAKQDESMVNCNGIHSKLDDGKLSTNGHSESKIETLRTFAPLAVVKIVCDWFRVRGDLFPMTPQNYAMWSTYAKFLNNLPGDTELLQLIKEDSRLQSEAPKNIREWQQKFPLIEDVLMRGVESMKKAQEKFDFSRVDLLDDLKAEAIIRVCSLRSFGYYLNMLNPEYFNFDEGRSEFTTKGNSATENVETDKRNTLMRSMAQLRLKNELATAEKTAWIPVYLVPDASTLCDKLPIVKRLHSAQRFVIVVPTAVVDELDKVKKEVGPARAATRWLESQFSRGNKFVRMQKAHEQDSTLDEILSSRKLPPNAMDILKCCAYLRKSVNVDTSSTVVTCLVNKSSDEDTKFSNHIEAALQTADVTGVAVADTNQFFSKWSAYRKKKS